MRTSVRAAGCTPAGAVRVGVLVIGLAACSPTWHADPDTGDTDAGSVPAGWPAGLPACLDAPDEFPLATADDVALAWSGRPRLDVVAEAMSRARAASDALACPATSGDGCGDGLTLAGDCAAGALTASGTAVSNACDDGGTWTFTGFSVTDDGWSFAADGTAGAAMRGLRRLRDAVRRRRRDRRVVPLIPRRHARPACSTAPGSAAYAVAAPAAYSRSE
jgi:hypothetical protein